jgi:hypothetical protein
LKIAGEQKPREALWVSDANLGMLDDEPTFVAIEIEGSLDLMLVSAPAHEILVARFS